MRYSQANDPWAIIRELVRRVEVLEKVNPLNFSSIDGGTGLALNSSGAVHVEGTGSLTADQLAIDRANGGRLKVGNAAIEGTDGGRVGAGGTFTDADGKIGRSSGAIQFKNGIAVDGGATVEGVVYGKAGTRINWKGGTGLVDGLLESVESIADQAKSAASTAQSAANAAKSRADDAYSLANSKAGPSSLNDLAAYARQIEIAGRVYMNQLNTRVSALEGGQLKEGIGNPPNAPVYG